MEGALFGVPSIALSQAYGGVHGRPVIKWEAAETHAAPLIRKILAAGIPRGGLVNINFPACDAGEVAGVAFTRQGQRNAEMLRVEHGRGFPYFWLTPHQADLKFEDGTDLHALAAKRISVTPLGLDLTDDDTRLKLEKAFTAR
jgi:5'-nucleotidase